MAALVAALSVGEARPFLVEMAGTARTMTRMGRLGWTLDVLRSKRLCPCRADRDRDKQANQGRARSLLRHEPRLAAPQPTDSRCQKTVPGHRPRHVISRAHDNRGGIRTQQEPAARTGRAPTYRGVTGERPAGAGLRSSFGGSRMPSVSARPRLARLTRLLMVPTAQSQICAASS
jgi:hypothetical protein